MKAFGIGVAIALVATALTGCTQGPTQAEVTKALRAEMDEANELAVSMLGEAGAAKERVEIHAVTLDQCSLAEEEDEFLCRIELDVSVSPTERKRVKTQVRMAKENPGWRLIKQL